MKISIDLDGTLWSHMWFFRTFMRIMQEADHNVGILTAHNQEERSVDIGSLLSEGFPIPDFWFGKEDNHPETKYWNKAKVILREGIDIHFDDCNEGKSIEEYRRMLGDESYRLIVVEARKPLDMHFE